MVHHTADCTPSLSALSPLTRTSIHTLPSRSTYTRLSPTAQCCFMQYSVCEESHTWMWIGAHVYMTHITRPSAHTHDSSIWIPSTPHQENLFLKKEKQQHTNTREEELNAQLHTQQQTEKKKLPTALKTQFQDPLLCPIPPALLATLA
jgi:hypothetical protein